MLLRISSFQRNASQHEEPDILMSMLKKANIWYFIFSNFFEAIGIRYSNVNVKTGKHLVFHNSVIRCWGLWRCCKVKSKEETAEVVGSQGFHPKTLLRTKIFLFENSDTALPS